MRISTLLVGIIVIGLIITAFMSFIGNLNEEYETNINESELETFRQIDAIYNISKDAKEQTENIKENPNLLDKISSFLNSGWIALKTTMASFDVVNSMTDDVVTKTGVSRNYVNAFNTIMIILIIIGVLIAAILKWRV